MDLSIYPYALGLESFIAFLKNSELMATYCPILFQKKLTKLAYSWLCKILFFTRQWNSE